MDALVTKKLARTQQSNRIGALVGAAETSNTNNVVVVVYDSITNSVFAGQLLAPLITLLESHTQMHVYILSFECDAERAKIILETLARHPRLQIKITPRFRFWGKWALLPCAWHLKSFLRKFDHYSLIARGPFAGWIAQHAYTAACTKLTIQARGLAAEEYRYAHPYGLWATLRTWQYKRLEKLVYGTTNSIMTIEAVSKALQQFLIDEYHTPSDAIQVAAYDIPQPIAPEKISSWRKSIRTTLHIPENTYVYCYNGSAKPWQCPEETITYFKAVLDAKPHAVLLILTNDRDSFLQLLHKHHIAHTSYRICTVSYDAIYHYLAAADAGILFRKRHCINWVSRPTKVLEYQAVGLEIIHNNTVGILAQTQ